MKAATARKKLSTSWPSRSPPMRPKARQFEASDEQEAPSRIPSASPGSSLWRGPSSCLQRFLASLSLSLCLLFSPPCLLFLFSRNVQETSGLKATPVIPSRLLSVPRSPSGGLADAGELRVSFLPAQNHALRPTPLLFQMPSVPLEGSPGPAAVPEAPGVFSSPVQARMGESKKELTSRPFFATARLGEFTDTKRLRPHLAASFLSPRRDARPGAKDTRRTSESASSLFAASASSGEAEPPPGAVSCGAAGCRIIGVGSATPSHEMTNSDMAEVVETTDEWIRTRTGIRSRRVLSTSESLRPLAISAARRALQNAKVKARDVDLVLHASSSPDDLFGDATSIAAGIVHAERIEEGTAGQEGDAIVGPAGFDLTAACSGFLVGLISANAFLTSPCCPYKRILVVGADALTRWIDWTDRNTCVLFGDGAGAVVLERQDATTQPPAGEGELERDTRKGILSYMLNSDGLQAHQLTVPFKGIPQELKRAEGKPALCMSQGGYASLAMNGREVFKFVSRKVPPAIEAVVQAAGLRTSDIDWLLLHQANKRIMDAVAERLKMPLSKVLCNLDKYGNTSAASIPLCLDEAVREGKVKPGDVVVTAGFGAGLTWSAAVFRYG